MEQRFWEKVEKSEGCWNWIGALSVNFGYGMFNQGKDLGTIKAHRLSWKMQNSEIPEGMMVCHRCDNPKCVRPDHLFLGTAVENNRDKWEKGRQGRFTPEKARRIRSLHNRHKDVLTHRRIADWFGVSKATITHMLTGRNWSEA